MLSLHALTHPPNADHGGDVVSKSCSIVVIIIKLEKCHKSIKKATAPGKNDHEMPRKVHPQKSLRKLLFTEKGCENSMEHPITSTMLQKVATTEKKL